jgi:hypothetical protein
MGKIKNTLLTIPLIFSIGSCTLIDNLFNPKLPDPIEENINKQPTTQLVIEPSSGYEPLNTEISVEGNDEDGKIIEYKVEIDVGADGTIDEVIKNSNPIRVERTFEKGKHSIYGSVLDNRRGRNSKSIEVLVLEQPAIPNKLPIVNFSANPISGKVPLTTDISLNGSDEDGKIIEYKVEIDVGADGTIDEVVKQSSPINISRTYRESGNIVIYGQVTDDKGGINKKNLSLTPEERGEIGANITLKQNYKLGDKFTFDGIIQNKTSEDLTIDNYSKKGSLVYRTINSLTNKTLFEEDLGNLDFSVTFYKNGKIKMEYGIIDDGIEKIKYTIENSNFKVRKGEEIISWDIVPGQDFFNEFFVDNEGEILDKAGTYKLETKIKYSIHENEYIAKFISDEFKVE